ncbi:hypothetical protein E4T47_06691 [Aureobasidium subglaciale]|nr:hypothetical protein E4T47_06691 [Aureobasidium subglaciale]
MDDVELKNAIKPCPALPGRYQLDYPYVAAHIHPLTACAFQATRSAVQQVLLSLKLERSLHLCPLWIVRVDSPDVKMAPSVLADTYAPQAIFVSWAHTRAFAQEPSTISVVVLICAYLSLTGGAIAHHLVASSPPMVPPQPLVISSPIVCAGEVLIMLYYWMRYGFTDLRFRGASKLLVADFEGTGNHLAPNYKHLPYSRAWLSVALSLLGILLLIISQSRTIGSTSLPWPLYLAAGSLALVPHFRLLLYRGATHVVSENRQFRLHKMHANTHLDARSRSINCVLARCQFLQLSLNMSLCLSFVHLDGVVVLLYMVVVAIISAALGKYIGLLTFEQIKRSSIVVLPVMLCASLITQSQSDRHSAFYIVELAVSTVLALLSGTFINDILGLFDGRPEKKFDAVSNYPLRVRKHTAWTLSGLNILSFTVCLITFSFAQRELKVDFRTLYNNFDA